jgi:hypothetical protein
MPNDRKTLEAIRDDYAGVLADAGTAAQIGLEAMDLADQLAEALRNMLGEGEVGDYASFRKACFDALAAYEEARR